MKAGRTYEWLLACRQRPTNKGPSGPLHVVYLLKVEVAGPWTNFCHLPQSHVLAQEEVQKLIQREVLG